MVCCLGFLCFLCFVCFFFFNDTATTEIYTLSLHDALPISAAFRRLSPEWPSPSPISRSVRGRDRKSTRLNSSHSQISYAVFCLKKKIKDAVRHPAAFLYLDALLSGPLMYLVGVDSAGIPASAPFFFNDTATTEIYTLSLHDALPI